MEPLSSDIDGVIKRFSDLGGKYILSCAIDIESAHREIEISMENDQVSTGIGFHPEITIPGGDDYKSCISEEWIDKGIIKLSSLIEKHKQIVAIGEIGLDYYWVKKSNCDKSESIYSLQKYLLKTQLDLATKKNMPVVLHCRDIDGDKQCESDILGVISGQCGSCVRGVFHSYTGSLSYLDEVLNLGFYVSFNPIVMFKNSDNVRNILDKVPDDRLLLETDSPLLVPPEERKKGSNHSEPYMVAEVANYIANRRNISPDRLWEIVGKNFTKLFNM